MEQRKPAESTAPTAPESKRKSRRWRRALVEIFDALVPAWLARIRTLSLRHFGMVISAAVVGIALLGMLTAWAWSHREELAGLPVLGAFLSQDKKPPRAAPGRFGVVVAVFPNDEQSNFHQTLIEGLKEQRGIQVLALGTSIPNDLSDTPESFARTRSAIDDAFRHTRAQILIWGDVLRAGDSYVLKLHVEPAPGIAATDRTGRYQFNSTLEVPEPLKQKLADVAGLIIASIRSQIETDDPALTDNQLMDFINRVSGLVDPNDPKPLLNTHQRVTVASALSSAEAAMSERVRNLYPVMISADRLTRLIAKTDPKQWPDDWARLQYNLSICGWALAGALERNGQKELAAKVLAETFNAVRASLTVYSYERTPRQWAASNLALAIYQYDIGKKTRDPSSLDESISSARAALIGYSFERFPGERWFALMVLGDSLAERGLQLKSAEDMKAAFAAYTDAAQPFYRENLSGGWTVAQVDRAGALLWQGLYARDPCALLHASQIAQSLYNNTSIVIDANKRKSAAEVMHYAARAIELMRKHPAALSRECKTQEVIQARS